MSPTIYEEGPYKFYFHSYDIFEGRPSVHVAKGTPSARDPKIWLEPEIEVARWGRSLRRSEIRSVLDLIQHNLEMFLEAWYEYRRSAGLAH